MFAGIFASLGGKLIAGVAALAFLLGVYAWITTGAYNRGFAERDTQAREQIAKMEQRMAERLRQNEGLTEDEVDCALRRIRNPKAECK